jgi:uncharacterized protein YdgA (DUF945 family)
MNKAASVTAGVIVAAGVLACVGAWYTGTRLEGVLQDSIRQANQQMQQSMPGADGKPRGSIELVSLDRHLFSSEAHYRLTVQGHELGLGDAPVQLEFVDHIEHGPLPLSRLKSLDLVPVMAVSNFALQNTPATQNWFAMNGGAVPLKGQAALHYDRSTDNRMELLPLQLELPGRVLKFSAMTLNVSATQDAAKYQLSGVLDSLLMDITGDGGPLHAELHGLDLSGGGTRGASGFYLGHTDIKVASTQFQVPGRPAVLLSGTAATSLLQEVEGKLSAQVNYDVSALRVGDKDIGTAQMAWKFDRFDIAASKSLNALYQNRVVPQQQAAMLMDEPLELHLTQADREQLNTAMTSLLSAKPHIELEKFSLKTANGESHMSLVVDLDNPGLVEQQPADLWLRAISQLDAKVLLSKPMISDVASAQAQLQGLTDPTAIATQAKNASDTLASMAVMFQWGKVEGDNVVSNLHYANGTVDFNGQKMTPHQFIGLVAGRFVQQ